GNNAAIVWPDADLSEAAQRVAAGALELAGQRCTANRRVIVHESCRDAFVRLLLQHSAALRWGDPLQGETQIGPLVGAVQRDRVERFLDEAQAGILKVNQSTADAAVDVPFGGWKASGLGPPEHGAFDLEFCTRPQVVYGGIRE